MNENVNFNNEDVMEQDFIINDVTPEDRVESSLEDSTALNESVENCNDMKPFPIILLQKSQLHLPLKKSHQNLRFY